ncbi:hypothetical protein TNCV_3586571 [Trichonephila clavipes]|nr:hypothetical protein TNCV_3586571 [Trichonephila clavipes]
MIGRKVMQECNGMSMTSWPPRHAQKGPLTVGTVPQAVGRGSDMRNECNLLPDMWGVVKWFWWRDGDRFNSCQVIYSQFGLAIHRNDHQARRRFVEWAQNEIAVVPDFHKRNLFSDEAHFWLNGYVNKQNCRIWSEANPQVYVETPLHPEKLTVWCSLWAGGILLQ